MSELLKGREIREQLPRHTGHQLALQSDHRRSETFVLVHVLDMAWDEVEFALARVDLDSPRLRALMAFAIADAMRVGVHDPNRLKEIALEAIAAAY